MKLHLTGHRPVEVSRVRVVVDINTGLVHYLKVGPDMTPACDPPLKYFTALTERYLKDHPPTCLTCVMVGVWTPMFTA